MKIGEEVTKFGKVCDAYTLHTMGCFKSKTENGELFFLDQTLKQLLKQV